jgi:TIR domain
MEYSAFISYRHTNILTIYAEEFVKDLEDELKHISKHHKIFFDKNRINGIIEKTIAPALCKSVCMVVLFSPTYYEYDNHEIPWCVQELVAFHDSEIERLATLQGHLDDGDCFIIPVLFNAEEHMLPLIIKERTVHHHKVAAVSQLRLDKNSVKSEEYFRIIGKIAQTIHDLKNKINVCVVKNESIFVDCDNKINLPERTHNKVKTILQQYQDSAPTEDLLM